jgi:hypothetical protein
MSSYTLQQAGQSSYPSNPKHGDGDGCEPDFEPADQPKDPSADCSKVPEDKPPPTLDDPEKCLPDPCCNCPVPPASSPNCFDKLIADQAGEISKAESAQTFKTELESLLTKANAAKAEYTQDKYNNLVKRWSQLDGDISEFIRKLVCAVPCWQCLIECFVCPLLYEFRFNKQKLWGDGTLYPEVHSQSDLRYWHQRNLDAKQRIYDRIRKVLAAWEKPAQTIDKALTANQTLLDNSSKSLATGATRVVYDVFLQLVPMHLAIAPPVSSGHITRIAKKYTQFCDCDKGEPDDCCGPDVGELSLRQQLIGGPQPYLIDPMKFFDVICCLTNERYVRAKDALAKAKSAFEQVNNDYNRLLAEIDDKKFASIGDKAKGLFPVDCNWETKPANAAR